MKNRNSSKQLTTAISSTLRKFQKNNFMSLPITLSMASVESDPSAFVATHLYTPVSSGKTSTTDSRDMLFSNVIW